MRPWCDWCHNPMLPVDVVETGMRRGTGLVWLCAHPDCGHEREISVQFGWERLLLMQLWRARLLATLLEKHAPKL